MGPNGQSRFYAVRREKKNVSDTVLTGWALKCCVDTCVSSKSLLTKETDFWAKRAKGMLGDRQMLFCLVFGMLNVSSTGTITFSEIKTKPWGPFDEDWLASESPEHIWGGDREHGFEK